jgi:hypothetical protein
MAGKSESETAEGYCPVTVHDRGRPGEGPGGKRFDAHLTRIIHLDLDAKMATLSVADSEARAAVAVASHAKHSSP